MNYNFYQIWVTDVNLISQKINYHKKIFKQCNSEKNYILLGNWLKIHPKYQLKKVWLFLMNWDRFRLNIISQRHQGIVEMEITRNIILNIIKKVILLLKIIILSVLCSQLLLMRVKMWLLKKICLILTR